MWDGQPDPQGWVRWRPIPSTTDRAAIAGLEAELGQRFPDAYRELLTTIHFGVLDLGIGLRLRPHLPRGWRREYHGLREALGAMPGEQGQATSILRRSRRAATTLSGSSPSSSWETGRVSWRSSI